MIRFEKLITEIDIAGLKINKSTSIIENGIEIATSYTGNLFSFYICTTRRGKKFALFSYDNESDVKNLWNIRTIIENYTRFFGEISKISPIQNDDAIINNLLCRSQPCQNTTINTNYDIIEKESMLQLAHNMITERYIVVASDKALREFHDKKNALEYYNILKEAIEAIIR